MCDSMVVLFVGWRGPEGITIEKGIVVVALALLEVVPVVLVVAILASLSSKLEFEVIARASIG